MRAESHRSIESGTHGILGSNRAGEGGKVQILDDIATDVFDITTLVGSLFYRLRRNNN